jgi:hypothetical protein
METSRWSKVTLRCSVVPGQVGFNYKMVDIVRFEPKEFLAQGDRVVVMVAFEEYGDVSALVAEVRKAHVRT